MKVLLAPRLSTKVLFIFRCSKNWQKKSVHHHLLANDGAHFFFANFYCRERWKVHEILLCTMVFFRIDFVPCGIFLCGLFLCGLFLDDQDCTIDQEEPTHMRRKSVETMDASTTTEDFRRRKISLLDWSKAKLVFTSTWQYLTTKPRWKVINSKYSKHWHYLLAPTMGLWL